MTVHTLQATFSRGEMTPRLHARSDIQDYAQALATCRNWLVMRQGGLQRRSGMVWIANVRDSTKPARLFEFEFNTEQAYCLCFNGGTIRFFTLGGVVTQTPQSITAITKANPGVLTYSGSDTYANTDRVIVSGVVGMVEVNNREMEVASVNAGANTFQLSGVNTSGYTTYSSGGTVSEIYEVAHPYADADLFDIQIAQSGDTVYLSHADYPPMKLVRSAETSWTLSQIAFDDGPWLDEDTQGTTMTPAASGSIVPVMSGNTSPSGTVANSDGDADAWQVFDLVDTTVSTNSGTDAQFWSYDLGAGTKIADAYWIRSGPTLGDAPSGWKFQGSADGSTWITLDTQVNETVWGRNETRFYAFKNAQGYRYHRLYVTDVDGGTDIEIAGIGIHQSGDSQTASNLTASAITGINGGVGWVAADVGRTVRLLDADGHYRWARIVAVSSTTVVTVRIYGHSLSSLGAIVHWQLSAWSSTVGYPSANGFFEDRLGWAGSDAEPLKLWLSRSADYENHGLSDPVDDSDGINVLMTGGRLNRVGFLEEMDPLVAGTPGTMRVIGPLDAGAALSNTNIQQKANGTIGASNIQPLVIGVTMLFIDRYRKRIYEFAFDLNSNSYIPKELSIESDHLLRAGIRECSFQQDPDNLCWYPMENGRVAVLTYEQSQKIAGFVDVRVAGGGTADATVESTASIPSAGGDVTYAIVNRTIAGATQRSIEYTAPFYEEGNDLEDAIYADAAGSATGASLTSVSGLWYLRSESVGLLCDGEDVGDATVSSTGVLTLPAACSTVVWGKRYTSLGTTLRAPTSGNQDGSALGRKMTVSDVKLDLLYAKGMKAGTLTRTENLPRDNDPRAAGVGELNTGMFPVTVIDKHDNNGVVVFSNNSMYPAIVRAMQAAVEGEP